MAIARVGVAKAAVLVPIIERTREWESWTQLGDELSYLLLQARVSVALQALPRGHEPSPPGERFRRAVLSAMPDIDAMLVAERFFQVGATVVGTRHPVGIFLAGCRECLAEWEVHAARREKPELSSEASEQDGREPEFMGRSHGGEGFCPRGQNLDRSGKRSSL